MQTYFSPSTGGFYPDEDLELYRAAGTLPTDLIEMSEDECSAQRDRQLACRYGAASNGDAICIPATDDDIAEDVRRGRDRLLAQCDWTQLPDVPMATREAWLAYRQALRDVPEQTGFPREVVWPTAPA